MDRQTNTTEDFIATSKLIHEDVYSYNRAIYTSSKNKVIITCPHHGDFFIDPLNHLNGRTCPSCQ